MLGHHKWYHSTNQMCALQDVKAEQMKTLEGSSTAKMQQII